MIKQIRESYMLWGLVFLMGSVLTGGLTASLLDYTTQGNGFVGGLAAVGSFLSGLCSLGLFLVGLTGVGMSIKEWLDD